MNAHIYKAPPTTTAGDNSELNAAGPYFDLGPRKVTQPGTYYYLCTRNNNFSNRDQKSKIIVQKGSQIASEISEGVSQEKLTSSQ